MDMDMFLIIKSVLLLSKHSFSISRMYAKGQGKGMPETVSHLF